MRSAAAAEGCLSAWAQLSPSRAVHLQLSYYADGLRREELRAALRQLLGLGPSAQRDVYEHEWLPLSRPGMAPGGWEGACRRRSLPLTFARTSRMRNPSAARGPVPH